MNARYGIFSCPDDSTPLAAFGEQALGRRADGSSIEISSDSYPDAEMASSLRKTPAHYGFHATLKAPFQLAEGASETALLEAVEQLAVRQKPVHMYALSPRVLTNFVALAFETQPLAIAALAEQCVIGLEGLREPMSAEDISRRQPAKLNSTQRSYLHRYGYPYVLSEFQFHMTLTGEFNQSTHKVYGDWLNSLYGRIVCEAPTLDRLAVVWQPDRVSPFKRIAQFAFDG